MSTPSDRITAHSWTRRSAIGRSGWIARSTRRHRPRRWPNSGGCSCRGEGGPWRPAAVVELPIAMPHTPGRPATALATPDGGRSCASPGFARNGPTHRRQPRGLRIVVVVDPSGDCGTWRNGDWIPATTASGITCGGPWQHLDEGWHDPHLLLEATMHRHPRFRFHLGVLGGSVYRLLTWSLSGRFADQTDTIRIEQFPRSPRRPIPILLRLFRVWSRFPQDARGSRSSPPQCTHGSSANRVARSARRGNPASESDHERVGGRSRRAMRRCRTRRRRGVPVRPPSRT